MIKSNVTLFLLLGFPFLLLAQQVTTLNSNSGADDGLFFDAAGNLYGSHYMGSAVFKITPGTWESEIFSDGYDTPNGLAIGADGNLYMADNIGNKIYRIFSDGTKEVFVDLINPSGLILEPDSDTLIATSYEGHRIVKIGPDGGQVEFSAGGLLNGPVGLCYDDDGRLYTGNFGNRKIIRFEENGDQVLIAQPTGGGALGFIAYANGYIYGTLFNQHKIYRTDLMGNDTILLGGGPGTVDGNATEARFNRPNGIIASPSQDTLYVSDFSTRALRMITDLHPVISASKSISKSIVEISLYPNPSNGEMHMALELAHSCEVSIQVADILGKQVGQALAFKSLEAGKHHIPMKVEGFTPGMYYVHISMDNEVVITKSFVVR